MGRYARSRCRLHLEEWTSLKTSLAPFLFLFFPDDVSIIPYTHTHIHASGLLVARANLPDRFNSPCATGQEERKRVGCGSPLEYRDSRLSVTRSSSSASDKSPSFHFRCNARGKLEFYAAEDLITLKRAVSRFRNYEVVDRKKGPAQTRRLKGEKRRNISSPRFRHRFSTDSSLNSGPTLSP